jgi:hypothetical protein
MPRQFEWRVRIETRLEEELPRWGGVVVKLARLGQ